MASNQFYELLNGGAVEGDTAENLRSNATTGVVQITGPAAATIRVITVPDANATMARTDAAQTFTGIQTYSSTNVLGAGTTINLDSAAASATGNDTTQSATVTKYAGTITTGALTTAANADTAVVLTLTGVAAGDIVLTTLAGGTNTTSVVVKSAIATTNTITVILRNDVLATTALNGTVAFHFWCLKQ